MEILKSRLRLPVDKLRWTCVPGKLPAVSRSKKPSLGIIGQDRALDALRKAPRVAANRRPAPASPGSDLP